MVAKKLSMRRTRYTGRPIRTNVPDMMPSAASALYEAQLARVYGRDLQGASVPVQPSRTTSLAKAYRQDTWGGADKAKLQASIEDDNVGNGIFDGPGAPAVQHSGSGVFEARYAEPGWLYRERLTRPGPGVDTNSGLPTVSIPAGGSWSGEMSRAYRPWDDETPRLYGMGQTENASTTSLMEYALGGLVAGAAGYVVWRLLKGK